MKVLPIADNIDYYLNNINLIKVTNLHRGANVFSIGQKINELTVIQPMQYKDLPGRYEGILWICKCSCGMYYILNGSRLKLEPPKCCPACDEHKIVDENYNVRYSGKGEEYYIQKYIDVFYKYYEPYMELEDFRQEIWYWFLYCENKFGNKFYHLGHYLVTSLNRLKRSFNNEVMDKNRYNLDNEINFEIDDIEDKLDRDKLITKIISALNDLDPKYCYVIKSRFGLDNYKIKTLAEIGKEFGITRERVRQIEAKTLEKLNNLLSRDD